MRSIVNENYTFNESDWLISTIMIKESKEFLEKGHALILVEGLLASQTSFKKKFTGQYELRSEFFNQREVVTEISIYEDPISSSQYNINTDTIPIKNIASYPSKSFEVNVADVKSMILAIKKQKTELDALCLENESKSDKISDYSRYPLYQVVRENQSLSETENSGSWCTNFLNAAGIHDLDDVINKVRTSSHTLRTRSSSSFCVMS